MEGTRNGRQRACRVAHVGQVLAWACCSVVASLVFAGSPARSVWYNDALLRAQLDAAIARFFGAARAPGVPLGDAQNHIPLLARRFAGVFDGVPGQRLPLSSGEVLYEGCKPHECGVAAALVVGQGRQVIAAAVTHWNCGSRLLPAERAAQPGSPGRAGGCDDPAWPTLTIFTRGARDPQAIAALEQWGRAHLEQGPTRLGGVRVVRMRVQPQVATRVPE